MQPFTIAVADGEIDALKRRLADTRWPDDFANDDWGYGANRDYLRGFVDHWLHRYDWRAEEAAMNRLSHFKTVIDDIPVHFVHVRGKGPNPTPLLLSHGWPWTFWDFAKVIGPLTDPAARGGEPRDAFDLVIPSLPGFVFSSPLRRTGIGNYQTCHIWAKLMHQLGYDRYGVQGGDFGGGITAALAHHYPDRVIGAHLTFPNMLHSAHGNAARPDPQDYAPDEADWTAHNAEMAGKVVSHVTVHSHDAQTLAYAFNDSPVGLAAWLLVRRRNASDCGGDLASVYEIDDLISSICLYWFTGTIGTSMRWYAETGRHFFRPDHDRLPLIDPPVAIAVFPREVMKIPRAYAARRFNLQRWTVMEKGGHYAPAEQPEAFSNDVRAFFADIRDGVLA